MRTPRDPAEASIQVDEGSVLARFAEWHSRLKGRPVAAVGPESREALLFVADEVIIDGRDAQLAEELRSRYGAEAVPEAPLPSPPAAFHRERRFDADAMPMPMRMRFAKPPPIDGAIDVLARAVNSCEALQPPHVVTSPMACAVAAVAARHAMEGRPIGLNLFGRTLAMPLSSATDGAMPGVGSNPFTWPAFAGRSRMVEAWQLVDSIRQVRGNRFTSLAILDNGFWLDNRGVPVIPPGQPFSDFANSFAQLNLQDESRPAGGMNPDGSPWHGNATASTAAATLNDGVGAAGSGGSVAFPMFFQSDFSIDQILRCVRICAAWGIDVLNMSFGTWGQTELWFPTSIWDKTFQFASDNGVVMIAAAGNDQLDLPDARNIRPATRTPGVLTVGALDGSDNAWVSPNGRGSNFGSSVWLWAPGTSIPVAPDQASASGSLVTGTSFASPMVAGVAAMMRFANPGLRASDVIRLLIDSGWDGSGRVTKGLDAFGAVFAAIHQALPDTDEPNNAPASARDLAPVGSAGTLGPAFSGFSARSTGTDPDYWRFRVEAFSTVSVAVDWYQRLSSLFVAVEADDPDANGPADMTPMGNSQSGRFVLTGLLPPGSYRVRVGGTGATAYRLLVTRAAAPLAADVFELNDSFAKAARLLFEATRWTIGLRTWPPGTYDATLHQERGVPLVTGGLAGLAMNDDFFRLDVPSNLDLLRQPTFSVHDADAPLDVTLFDASHQPLDAWTGVRRMSVHPPTGSICFVKVSGKQPTRYRITTRMSADPTKIPGPHQRALEFIPEWWGDPAALRLDESVTHFVVDINRHRGDGPGIAFEMPELPVRIELLDAAGEVVREAEPLKDILFVDTRGLQAGIGVLRISRGDVAGSSAKALRVAPPLH